MCLRRMSGAATLFGGRSGWLFGCLLISLTGPPVKKDEVNKIRFEQPPQKFFHAVAQNSLSLRKRFKIEP